MPNSHKGRAVPKAAWPVLILSWSSKLGRQRRSIRPALVMVFSPSVDHIQRRRRWLRRGRSIGLNSLNKRFNHAKIHRCQRSSPIEKVSRKTSHKAGGFIAKAGTLGVFEPVVARLNDVAVFAKDCAPFGGAVGRAVLTIFV